MWRQICSTELREAMSSQRVAISMPKKQGWQMGGAVMRMCTSRAPARRSISTTLGVVVPRTMESSTTTSRLPSRISRRGLNFR
jgi:hypothetical protein